MRKEHERIVRELLGRIANARELVDVSIAASTALEELSRS
jgi:hypothetical protein